LPVQIDELIAELQAEPLPVVVEFWAPWCAPCRVMAPILERMETQYAGQVQVRKLNADQHPDLLRALNVMAIPTLLVFHQGEEMQRRVGAQHGLALEALFARLAAGDTRREALPDPGMDPITRMLRLTGGLALLLAGIWLSLWPLLIAGGLLAFWGWYDRCPVWQALVPRLKELASRR
jgi:thioredoxin